MHEFFPESVFPGNGVWNSVHANPRNVEYASTCVERDVGDLGGRGRGTEKKVAHGMSVGYAYCNLFSFGLGVWLGSFEVPETIPFTYSEKAYDLSSSKTGANSLMVRSAAMMVSRCFMRVLSTEGMKRSFFRIFS